MKIAIVGTGNVGGALASKWAAAGHEILLGVQDTANFKGMHLLQNEHTSAHAVAEAAAMAEVILLATPAMATIAVTEALGDTSGKVIIDAMNVINGNGPEGYTNTSQAILDNTQSSDLAKCFNTTGFNNMENPVYAGQPVDVFTCGDSKKAKAVAQQLALDAGFAECYDVGGNDKFTLMEAFAFFWINLAMFQGQGREIAFKLLKR